MLTRVDVQSENPFYLEIRDAKPTDSIVVKKIEGLDPPDVTLFMGEYARDGGSYNGRRVPFRTVIFTLKLNPNYQDDETVDGLRKLLHKAFLDPFVGSDGLNIILHSDSVPDQFIQGVTDKFESDPFSEDTTIVISMVCPNPYIQDFAETVEEASGPTFPFEYYGTAETGILVTAEIISSTPVLTLDLNGTTMVFDYAFLEDDIVTIDTRRGSRRIQVLHSGDTDPIDILYSKVSGSTWLELHSLENTLKIYGEDDDDIIADLNSITFRALHWGV